MSKGGGSGSSGGGKSSSGRFSSGYGSLGYGSSGRFSFGWSRSGRGDIGSTGKKHGGGGDSMDVIKAMSKELEKGA
jgi:hypothetical protein